MTSASTVIALLPSCLGEIPIEKPVPTFPGLRLSPPEWLLGLADDLAPRQSDVVQVPVGPTGQFVALLPAVGLDMELVAELGQKAGFMIICQCFG